MLIPSKSVDKLGFTEIKELIKAHCLSEMGQQMVDRIQVMNSYDQVLKFLNQANEFKSILENYETLPIHLLFDIKSLAYKARIVGAFLSEEEFFQIQASLSTVFAVIAYFNVRQGQYPNLEALFEHLLIERSILKKIELVIDQKGKIRPNASRELADITSSIAKAEQEARRKIDQVFKNAAASGWTADGSLIGKRRALVYPAYWHENKRKLKGFIHDESASGQTVCMEPEEVFSLNNRIRDLEF